MKRYLWSLLAVVACAAHESEPSAPVANTAPTPTAVAAPPAGSAGSRSLKERALANGGCYGGATYGIQGSGLTPTELAALDTELTMEPGADEMSGGYGYSPPRAATVFPRCTPKATRP